MAVESDGTDTTTNNLQAVYAEAADQGLFVKGFSFESGNMIAFVGPAETLTKAGIEDAEHLMPGDLLNIAVSAIGATQAEAVTNAIAAYHEHKNQDPADRDKPLLYRLFDQSGYLVKVYMPKYDYQYRRWTIEIYRWGYGFIQSHNLLLSDTLSMLYDMERGPDKKDTARLKTKVRKMIKTLNI